ncbi:MAG: Abi family protein [Clostridiales bacterium]|nr:Abi family protein [Clostridiales bacterium]
MVDFKTYEQQIDILRNRNLIIGDKQSAIDFLNLNNYYNVINAYKDIFIQQGYTPEKFIDGTTFDDFVQLYNFDKLIRLALSDFLIIIERVFKSIIAYEFSKAHGNSNIDYTNINNFDTISEPTESSKLVTYIDNQINHDYSVGNKMICHYIDTHGLVPLWVNVNLMTFGNMSKFYMCMKESDKRSVAKNLSNVLKKNIQFNDISNSIKILVLLRNKTAHDQRIYDFSSDKLIVSHNNKLLKQHRIPPRNDLFGALCCMNDFLLQDDFNNLQQLLSNFIKEIKNNVDQSIMNRILNKMGIPQSFLI